MNWFNKKEKENEKFTFSTTEICHVGDKYEYIVEAKTKEEAFKKLVEYMFGNCSSIGIESKHYTVSRPNNYIFECENMPRWFAKRMNGLVRDKTEDYQKKLENYCKANDINLNPNY